MMFDFALLYFAARRCASFLWEFGTVLSGWMGTVRMLGAKPWGWSLFWVWRLGLGFGIGISW